MYFINLACMALFVFVFGKRQEAKQFLEKAQTAYQTALADDERQRRLIDRFLSQIEETESH